MRCGRSPILWIAALLCVTAGRTHGQSALVLSGGGARGLAHVGVLKVLDELGYEPDLVVGTSMGAVVGALYAAGYTADEIEQRILAVRWQDVFAPTPLVVGPARETRWPMLTIGMNARRQRVQRGLFGVWRINRGLTQMLFDATARSRGDFDRLPRRYRAVAADLNTGDAVVLDSGDVARAVRASMAVPGFFAPLEWDGRTLTDGGITDNLPIDLARRLGAQHIVAVDVSRPTPEIRDLAPMSVLQRALDLMQENAQVAAQPPDVLIVPQISAGVSGMSFPDDPRPLIGLGTEAAQRDMPRPPAQAARTPREFPAPRRFDSVRIEAPDSALAALARHAFAGIAGAAYDVTAVLAAVDRVYTTGLVEAVWTRVVDDPQPDDSPALVVRIEAPPPLTLDAGAGFENDRGGRAWAALTRYVALHRRPVLFALSASTDGLERTAALSITNIMLGRPVLAWSAGAYASEYNVRRYEEDVVRTQDLIRAGGWIGLEFPRVLRDRLTTAVVHAEWIDVEDGRHGYSAGPMLRFSALNPETMIVGVPFLVELERRWGEVAYTRATVRGSREYALGALRFAALVDVRGVSATAPEDVQPALGNDHVMPGLRWGQDRAPLRMVGGVDAAYPIGNAFTRLRVRAGTVETTPAATDLFERLQDAIEGRWTIGAQIAGVWRTPLGILDAGYGFNSRGHGRFDVSIGREF